MKPRITVPLVLLVVLVIGGLATLLMSRSPGGAVHRMASGSATPISPTPWPAGSERADQPCLSSALDLFVGERFSEPTQQHSLGLLLGNRSGTTCFLFGYPRVTLLDASGQPLPFDYRDSGDQVVTSNPPTRVNLSPGTVAYVTLNNVVCQGRVRAVVRTVELTLPHDPYLMSVPLPASAIPIDYCEPGDVGTVMHVSPFAATPYETTAH